MTYQRPVVRPLDLAVNAASCCRPYPQAPPGSCNPPNPGQAADPSSLCYALGTC